MIHEFVPPDFLEALHENTYWPKSNRKLNNPWDDPVIDSFHLLRFAILREYQARNHESISLFWRFMSREAEAIAEAERDMFVELYRDVFAAEMLYIQDKYLDKELESLDVDKIAKKVKQHAIDPDTVDFQESRGQARFGITRFMLPPDFLGHIRYNQELMRPTKAENASIIVTPIRDVTKAYLRRWGDNVSYLYAEIMQSTRIWHQDIVSQALQKNSLSGPSAKTRRFLINENIPNPDLVSFLGWYGICGIRWVHLGDKQQADLSGVIGFKPRTLITFIAPLLPITREHQGMYGSSLAQEDAHSNHSLAARNPAHQRDQYGRIVHGHYVATTATVGGGPPTILVTSQVQHPNTNPKAIAGEHLSALPPSCTSGRHYVISNNIELDMVFGMTGILSNPWMADQNEIRLPYEWARFATTGFDTPFRSLARFHGIIFRMDSIPAVNSWIQQFLIGAEDWLNTTRDQRMHDYFAEAVNQYRSTEPRIVSPKTGGAKFDLSGLFDSDE